MLKHYIGIGLLLLVIFIISALAFMETGSPVSQQALRYDETRLQDFQSISYSVENFYTTNKSLPKNLSDLKNAKIKDPETKKNYTYTTLSETSYQLCTDFDSDSKQNKKKSYTYYGENTDHSQGYDCIKYTIPDWAVKSAKQSQVKKRKGAQPYEIDIVSDTDCAKEGGVWDDGLCVFANCSETDFGDSAYEESTVTYGGGGKTASSKELCQYNRMEEVVCVTSEAKTPGFHKVIRQYTCSSGCTPEGTACKPS